MVDTARTTPLPSSVYAGLSFDPSGAAIALLEKDGRWHEEYIPAAENEQSKTVLAYLATYQKEHEIKILGAGLIGGEEVFRENLATALWLKHDIVPFFFVSTEKNLSGRARKAAEDVIRKFRSEHIVDIAFDRLRQVHASRLTGLEAYRSTSLPSDFLRFSHLAEEVRERKLRVVFFSSTPAGGGVALMRHALIRLFHLCQLDISWHVLSSDHAAFMVTKHKFHNVLQAIAAPHIRLSHRDKAAYQEWININADFFRSVYQNADIVVIDDPQPSGLIPFIRKASPRTKIIYRSHIQLRADLLGEKGTPQYLTWSFLKKNIYQTDLFVSHPIKAFIPQDLDREKVVLMPATTDPLDGLNKPLSKKDTLYYQRIFNRILTENGQEPLNLKRPYLIQIARFDPSKGIPDVIEAYRRLRKKFEDQSRPKKEIPQLVIVGHGAADDPESGVVLQEVFFTLAMDRYRAIASDVKVARVPHIDQLLNALLRGSLIALQLSHREGFEVKVTEALAKGIPVIAYKTGGLPLQIRDGENGYLVKTGDSKKVAELLFELLTHPKKLTEMSRRARESVGKNFWTVPNAVRWLFLFLELAKHGRIKGRGRTVNTLIEKRYAKKTKKASAQAH